MDRDRLGQLVDDEIGAIGILLGPESGDLLGSVLAEAEGLIGPSRITQIRYVPGRSLTVQYRAQVTWASGVSDEILVASTGVDVPDQTPRVDTGVGEVAVWRYPHDPFLPGLPAAASPERVGEVLRLLDAPSETVQLRRRSYRPGNRAVIEAVAPGARIYLKVVRPDRVADLQSRHAMLAQRLPIPHSYGWSSELGLVAMQAMSGKPLRRVLETGSRKLPDPNQILALLDMLGDGPAPEMTVGGPVRYAGAHANLLKRVLPELGDRLDAMVSVFDDIDEEEPVPVHGDFHSSQILVRGTAVTGLIDVDTVGLGARSDDLAGLLGHISTIALSSAARRSIDRYGRELIARFDEVSSPVPLRLRTAAVVLGFATGPFRVLMKRWAEETERRVALAESWAESAGS